MQHTFLALATVVLLAGSCCSAAPIDILPDNRTVIVHLPNATLPDATPAALTSAWQTLSGRPEYGAFVNATRDHTPELVQLLDSATGNVTVFAPTNEAFALVASAVAPLLAAQPPASVANPASLHALLAAAVYYHIHNGSTLWSAAIPAADQPGVAVRSLLGPLNVTLATASADRATRQGSNSAFAAGDKTVNAAKVVAADVRTSNGVVHGINRVLLPFDLTAH